MASRPPSAAGQSSQLASSSSQLQPQTKPQTQPQKTAEDLSLLAPLDNNSPEAYADAFSRLVQWVDGSLDVFRPELRRVLYPLFVHCYLSLVARGFSEQARSFIQNFENDLQGMHSSELSRLRDVLFPQHLRENELVVAFRSSRYTVHMSDFAMRLFVQFLQDQSLLLLSLANQYLRFAKRSTRHADFAHDDEDEDGIESLKRDSGSGTGQFSNAAGVSGSTEMKILWGTLEIDAPFAMAVDRLIKQGTPSEPPLVQSEQDADPLKVAQMKAATVPPKSAEQPPRDRIPIPKYKPIDVRFEAAMIRESKIQAELGGYKKNLPSSLMLTLQYSHSSVACVAFSQDTTLMAIGCQDSSIKVWNLNGTRWRRRGSKHIEAKGKLGDEGFALSRRLVGHRGPVYSLSFSHDNRTLISGSADGTIHLWSMDTLTTLAIYRGHNYPVWSVAYAPASARSHYFASGSHDRTARIWGTTQVAALRLLVGHSSDVDVVEFHPNANYLATGSSDHSVRVWDVLNGACVLTLSGHSSMITALQFSHEGRYLSSGSQDGFVCVWDLASGIRKFRSKSHEQSVTSISFAYPGPIKNPVIASETSTFSAGGASAAGSAPGFGTSSSSSAAAATAGSGVATVGTNSSNDAAGTAHANKEGALVMASGSLDGSVRLYDFQPLVQAQSSDDRYRGDRELTNANSTASTNTGSKLGPDAKGINRYTLGTYWTKDCDVLATHFNIYNVLVCAGQARDTVSASSSSSA